MCFPGHWRVGGGGSIKHQGAFQAPAACYVADAQTCQATASRRQGTQGGQQGRVAVYAVAGNLGYYFSGQDKAGVNAVGVMYALGLAAYTLSVSRDGTPGTCGGF